MVMIQRDGQHVDIAQMYYIQAGDGPILIGLSKAPDKTVIGMQQHHYENLHLLADRPGEVSDLKRLMIVLRPHHIRCGWYSPSPEVLDYVHDRLQIPAVARTGGRKLNRETALEVFRAAHSSSMSYRTIGMTYGIGPLSVGKIARGEVYADLFVREPAPDAAMTPPGWRGLSYYVSEARLGAPKYRMTKGKRGWK